MISVIIPIYNEAPQADFYLKRLANQVASIPAGALEILLVDGGSADQTWEICQAYPFALLRSPRPGRACQMNFGAQRAQGNIFLFLHLDSQLPPDFIGAIRGVLAQPEVSAGAFRFRVDLAGRRYRLLERLVNLRSQICRLPYGDQGLFMTRETFAELGGFADLPIMEDYHLVRRLQQRGRVAPVPLSLVTSGRRWRKLGFWKTAVINQLIVLGYHSGIAPARLARWYRGFS
ncbi:MAG: TIGR04283 family arsenosugar biosynthesis glycosyltransferase [Cyanobacteriota bacterium]|jgi:rSAM/selenodomain-associated transferase 2